VGGGGGGGVGDIRRRGHEARNADEEHPDVRGRVGRIGESTIWRRVRSVTADENSGGEDREDTGFCSGPGILHKGGTS